MGRGPASPGPTRLAGPLRRSKRRWSVPQNCRARTPSAAIGGRIGPEGAILTVRLATTDKNSPRVRWRQVNWRRRTKTGRGRGCVCRYDIIFRIVHISPAILVGFSIKIVSIYVRNHTLGPDLSLAANRGTPLVDPWGYPMAEHRIAETGRTRARCAGARKPGRCAAAALLFDAADDALAPRHERRYAPEPGGERVGKLARAPPPEDVATAGTDCRNRVAQIAALARFLGPGGREVGFDINGLIF